MQKFTIDIKISPEGQTSIEVNGIKGKSCENITKVFTDLGTVVETKLKPEYYQGDPEITIKRST